MVSGICIWYTYAIYRGSPMEKLCTDGGAPAPAKVHSCSCHNEYIFTAILHGHWVQESYVSNAVCVALRTDVIWPSSAFINRLKSSILQVSVGCGSVSMQVAASSVFCVSGCGCVLNEWPEVHKGSNQAVRTCNLPNLTTVHPRAQMYSGQVRQVTCCNTS
jgi:hypothetical protein